MFKRTQICTGVLLAIGGTMLAVPARAQQPSEVVEVTGSRIKRVDAENAAPVTILRREDIEKSGATNASEVIRSLTGDSNGSIPTAFGAGFAAGASAVSLRGLGVNSTLVLVNGRRIAPYGLADDGQRNFTDLSSIPLDAIDRIEVLKEGASALYGADAVGGVINIFLRNTFQGISLNVSGGMTRYSDGKNARASITAGFGDLASQKFNVFANLEASKQNPIWEKERSSRGPQWRQDMSEAGYDYLEFNQYGILIPGVAISGGPSGAVRDASGGFNYRFLPCRPGALQPSATALAQYPELADNYSSQNGSPANCIFNPFDYYMVQPKEERLNLFVRGTVQLGGDWQLYSELSRFQTKVETANTPSSVSSSWPDVSTNTLRSNATITIADTHPDNPYAPDGAANRLRYHTADLGGRDSKYDTVASRALVGIKGTAGAWDLDAGVMYSESVSDIERYGFLRNSVLRDYLSGTNVSGQNPGLLFYRIGAASGLNSAATRAAISPTLANETKTSVTLVDVRAGRELTKLAGGPLAMSVGAEWRKEELSSPATPYTTEADIVGLGFSEFFGSRTIYALYGELVAPVIKGLELNFAARYDHYSDVGNSTTPKVGFKWTPVNALVVRGSYSESFRAPGPAESGNSASAGFTNYVDPLLCPGGTPVTGATAADCSGTVIVSATGNPLIKPETAKSYTLGLVFEPTPDTNVSLDYWRVDRKDEISQPDAQQILNNPTIIPGAQIIRQDDGRGLIGVGDPSVNGGAGAFAVAGVIAPYFNTNKTKTDGIDLDLRHRFNLGSAGRLTTQLGYTHILSFKREFPDGSTLEYAGSHGPTVLSGNGGMPKDRATLSLSWDVGPWSTTGRVNHVGAFSNKETANDTDCLNHFADGTTDAPSGCKIASFTTFDLGLKWSGIKNLDIYGGIKNVFDAKSPYDPQVYSAFHYNPIYHLAGAIGRSYSLGLRYTFK
jgi:iron complex outermembrane receptor protein